MFVLLVCLRAASASPEKYRFDSWTADNGLPQNSVYSILQTRDGYLWFTTLDGVARYDGARFTVFNKANSRGILSNRFTRLYEDSRGALWICTEEGGLTRYSDGAFTTYTTADGLPHNWIYNVRETADGALLISAHTGLSRLKDGVISVLSTKAGHFESVLGYEGPSGALWYRLDDKLRCFKDGKSSEYSIPKGLLDDQYSPQLYEDRQGRLWIGSTGAGLTALKDGMITSYTVKDGLPSSPVTAFCQDRLGALWFGTERGGLVRFEDGKFTTYTVRDGLSSNHVINIFEDREGTMWIGTGGGGLSRMTRQIVSALSSKEGLVGNIVYPIIEDRAGNIWAGSWGINKFKDGRFTNNPLKFASEAKEHNLAFLEVTALCEDSDNRLWIGSDRVLLSLKDGRFSDETDKLGSKNSVRVIYQDREGALWIGTNLGLVRYKDGSRTLYTLSDGLAGDEIATLLEDRQGRLLVGTYSGLSLFTDGRFTSYTEPDELGSVRVRSLYEDRDGALWIGSYDSGLARFKDGRFTRYTTADGLFNNGVFQILEDDHDNLWMSCNAGIYRASRHQLNDFADGKTRSINCLSYGKADGMLNVECNGDRQPAGIRSRDGRLWFPTFDGIAVIDPDDLPFNNDPPPVVIQQVILEREPVDFNRTVDVLPSQRGLEIHYAGLSFIKPEHVRFRYMLEGFDRDWTEAGSRRAAYYPHLPPGEYTFRVIAANSDGVWNMNGATMRIRVLPPFWQTSWFILLAAATVLVAGGLAYRARVVKLERAHAVQQEFSRQLINSQENERKRIGAELHDSLGQSLIVIKNLASMIIHQPKGQEEMCRQVDEISEEASRAIGEVKEISYNLRPFHLDRLGLTRAIESLIDNVSKACDIEFAADLDSLDSIFTKEEEINLYRIVQEGLNNIVKHSGATQSSVIIRRGEHDVAMTIKDNGRGFTPETYSSDLRKSGFGLIGIGERARMLGGEHRIDSEPGRGTTILIRIDLKGRENGR